MCRALHFLALTLAAQALVGEPVTFNKHIAPIVFKNCVPCHRPGESGPFSLLTYDDVKKHARQIVTVTKSRYMPPWLPDTGFVRFADERRLRADQIRLIERWVEQGEAQGPPADLPPLPKFATAWQRAEPVPVPRLPQSYTLPAAGPAAS